MCGIVAYVGRKVCQPVLIEGLKRLEYRGYDSAGVAVVDSKGQIAVRRAVGRISVLETKLQDVDPLPPAHIGMAHTRWATHGAPTEVNAHPHIDDHGEIALVHNGIIENYAVLKKYLGSLGHTFKSQTDTEVLAVLVGHVYGELKAKADLKLKPGQSLLAMAVQNALTEVTGTYGIAVLCKDEPETLVVARKGSPLIIGVGDSEYIVASDAAAIVEHTAQVIYLNDNEMAVLKPDSLRTSTIDDIEITPAIQQLESKLDEYELGEYEHYMLKEIFEQPAAIDACLRGRCDAREGRIVLGGVANFARDLAKARRLIMAAQGTALHAGMVGDYLFEDLAKVQTECTYASEFRYRNPLVEEGTVLMAISQSGETADTLAALREAKDKGALALGIVNVVGSTIARETDAGIYLHAGPEIGVASTKAFTAQLSVLACLALAAGRANGAIDAEREAAMTAALLEVPGRAAEVLENDGAIQQIAQRVAKARDVLFLGRGNCFPIALEGALKLKEISYIHAEGYAAGEMKHGPIALIDPAVPVIAIAPSGPLFEKTASNLQEAAARGGQVIVFSDAAGAAKLRGIAVDTVVLPTVDPFVAPILYAIPVQVLAYHVAVLKGTDVDQPRNLAKSVTVE
jgi:glutamine---fructose-6-phosphate transaminase (isomerizing)